MSSSAALTPRQRRQAMALLFSVLLLVMMGFSVLFPIQAYYIRQFGADTLTMGLLTSIYSVMHFIAAPIWGRISDRVGRRPVLMAGLLGFVFSQLMFGLATQIWMLFVARTLGGLLSAAAMPTAMAYIADVTSEEERAKGMGLMGAAFGLGVIIGPAIGGPLGTISLALPFFVSASLSFLAFLGVLTILPESLPAEVRGERKSSRKSRWGTFSPHMTALYLITLVLSLGMAGVETTFSFLAADVLHLGPDGVSWVFVAMGIVSVIVQGGLVGRIQKALGETRMMILGLVIATIGMAWVVFIQSPVWATVAICVLAVGMSLARPANSALISRHARTGQGVAIGVMDSFDSLGRIIGPSLGGAIYKLGPTLPYASGALLFAVACGLALFWSLAGVPREATHPSGD